MASCDMCGKEAPLYLVKVEGVTMSVCDSCKKFGKVMQRPILRPKKKQTLKPEREIVQVIKNNYSILIKQEREKRGLKQEELAKKLAEKQSLIHKIEAGQYVPDLKLTRKLEKVFKITLIEEKEITSVNTKTESKDLTIGDLIKVRGA